MKCYLSILGVLLTAWLALPSAESRKVSYSDCGSKVGKILAVDISPCRKEPCILERGTNITATLEFLPLKDITSAKISTFTVFAGLSFPLPLPNPDLCSRSQDYGVECPIASGVPAKVVVKREVEAKLFPGSLPFKLQLENQDFEMIVCFKITLEIS